MLKRIARWLDIYDKEIGLFLWTMALLFLVRSSGMLLNNYAETAFLKRYGVEFMPVVNMLNAIVTMVVMGIIAGFMQRFPGPNLLAVMFLITGTSVMGLRLLIPFDIDLIYPILFMLKALYEVLLALLFWNLANDLFNTRQSKRLFPLITAGGVVGQILGSFGTPWLVRWFNVDNLLVIYMVISIVGALAVRAMMRRFPSLLMVEEPTGGVGAKKKSSMLHEIKSVLPVMKKSLLLRLMIVLTLMPNVVIPIMNYQFNFAVDRTFATETGMIEFFSYFRGVMNIVSLVILLFVGKIYGRWGLPVALMFHPLNYIFAFTAFLLRFDVLSAIYARMSTQIIRTTINIPANAVVMGLFPESFRAMVRPFLRGTVVRIGLFVGSGLILIGDRLFHPRYLSLVALPFVLAWLVAPLILKFRYAGILSNLIKDNQLDLKSLEENDVGQLFREKSIQSELADAFLKAGDREVVWYAHMLHRIKVPDMDRLLIQRIVDLPTDLQIELLEFLTPDVGANASSVLTDLAESDDPTLTLAVLKTVHRLGTGATAGFDRTLYLAHQDPYIRAYAVAGLMAQAPETAYAMINAWIDDHSVETRKAGIIAAGLTRDTRFVPTLAARLENPGNEALLPDTIDALHAVGEHELNTAMASLLKHKNRLVRLAALRAYHVTDKTTLKTAVALLADADPDIRHTAARRIESAQFHDGKTLIKALSTPSKEARELIFDLLDSLQIKDPDVFRFARNQIEGAYKSLAESEGLLKMPQTPSRDLLLDHLSQQRMGLLENVLRVLSIEDRSGRMRIISRGLLSTDTRQKANSQEAIDDLIDRSLTRILLPLLDDIPIAQQLAIGRKEFKVNDFSRDSEALCRHLLGRYDWLAVLMALQINAEAETPYVDMAVIEPLANHSNPHISAVARQVTALSQHSGHAKETIMAETLTLPKIILWLKKIEIFEQLAVNELAAVASVTEEVEFQKGQEVIREGDPGETLYLIIEGRVAVFKQQDDGGEIELDRMDAGDYFGEMALFEDIPRTATIRTIEPSRMLMLHKQEFKEMVREYPQIALDICKALSGRIRKLHSRMTQ